MPLRPLDQIIGTSVESVRAQFDQHVDRSGGPVACWPWSGTRNKKGYGRFKHALAHRVAYKLATGTDPGQFLVCHTCDNPPCCNPTHLFLGDDRSNQHDSKMKGRRRIDLFFIKSRISDEQRADLLERWERGESSADLAARFGLSASRVMEIAAEHGARAPWQRRGFLNSRQRLSDADVAEIRRAHGAGEATQRVLALKFGVSASLVGLIIQGRRR
ncbi:HNH endonuclease signature motif containing protein [Pseudonocardia hispaniensis]|uniref:HNH endonuclease signature motif containing protein n=1 Tax=Pseudonocardia hispaniensis TaxID=904933 RepID=A0ABW1IWQ9_9PSEU